MEDDPYRQKTREGDAKLEKLAAEGRHRIADAAANESVARHAAHESKRDKNLRAALGAYYGTPQRKVAVLLMVLSPVALFGWIVVGLLHDHYVDVNKATAAMLAPIGGLWWIAPVSCFVFIGATVMRYVSTPLATHARVDTEKAWARSLPFGIEDAYFEVLAADPESECRLAIDMAWDAAPPSLDVVQGVVGMVDTGARAERKGSNVVHIHTGPISGQTGVVVSSGANYEAVLRNDRIVAFVHELVEKVLLPLHDSSPIARVKLWREP